MAWGRSNESLVLEKYTQEKLSTGSENLVVTQSGLWVSPDYPFLGASPDASVYDPSETQAFGFVEVNVHSSTKTSLQLTHVLIPPFVVNW